MVDIFPSIVPGRDEPFVDDEYSAAELDRMDGNELQSLAAKHPTDDDFEKLFQEFDTDG